MNISEPNTRRHPWKTHQVQRVINNIRFGYKVLVILRGLPGSGKSHLAGKLLLSSLGHSNYMWHIFSPHPCETEEENQWRAHYAMHFGVSPIIIDDTNTQMWEMYPYAISATYNGYIIEILEPNTSWAYNVVELAKKNHQHISATRIFAMLQNYDWSVTVQRLFQYYNLVYRIHPPQYRSIPPILNLEQFKTLHQDRFIENGIFRHFIDTSTMYEYNDYCQPSYDFNANYNIVMCEPQTQINISSGASNERNVLENSEIDPVDCDLNAGSPRNPTLDSRDQNIIDQGVSDGSVISIAENNKTRKSIDQSCMTDNDQDNRFEDLVDLLLKLPRSALEDLIRIQDARNQNHDQDERLDFWRYEPQPSTSNMENFSTDSLDEDDDDNVITKTVGLTLGDVLIKQLNSLFGGYDDVEGSGPVVIVPVDLAMKIYSLYIKSLKPQLASKEEIFESCDGLDLLPSDLQIEKLSNSFPKIHKRALLEIYAANGYAYSQTFAALGASVTSESQNELKQYQSLSTVVEMQEIEEEIEHNEEIDDESSAASQATDISRMRRFRDRRMRLERNCRSGFDKRGADCDKLDRSASARCGGVRVEGTMGANALDVHRFCVKAAILAVDIFVDKNVFLLKKTHGSCEKELFVLTGRSKDGEGGRSTIKTAVIERLERRKIDFVELNSGLLKIVVRRDTPITSDIP